MAAFDKAVALWTLLNRQLPDSWLIRPRVRVGRDAHRQRRRAPRRDHPCPPNRGPCPGDLRTGPGGWLGSRSELELLPPAAAAPGAARSGVAGYSYLGTRRAQIMLL